MIPRDQPPLLGVRVQQIASSEAMPASSLAGASHRSLFEVARLSCWQSLTTPTLTDLAFAVPVVAAGFFGGPVVALGVLAAAQKVYAAGKDTYTSVNEEVSSRTYTARADQLCGKDGGTKIRNIVNKFPEEKRSETAEKILSKVSMIIEDRHFTSTEARIFASSVLDRLPKDTKLSTVDNNLDKALQESERNVYAKKVALLCNNDFIEQTLLNAIKSMPSKEQPQVAKYLFETATNIKQKYTSPDAEKIILLLIGAVSDASCLNDVKEIANKLSVGAQHGLETLASMSRAIQNIDPPKKVQAAKLLTDALNSDSVSIMTIMTDMYKLGKK